MGVRSAHLVRLNSKFFGGTFRCTRYKMIQQQIGDLLQIEEDGKYYYVVVLTKRVMFGGNILFVFHNDGEKRTVSNLALDASGFNICADLLLPKREGRVTRLHRIADLSMLWRSKYAKATFPFRPSEKAEIWYIYNIHDLGGEHIARIEQLSQEYREAMDSGCSSFDLVASKVLARYTPDQNARI